MNESLEFCTQGASFGLTCHVRIILYIQTKSLITTRTSNSELKNMLFCIASTIPRSMSVKSSTLFCRIAYIVSTYFLCLDTYDYVYACYINYIQTLATTYHIICVCKRILESNVGRIDILCKGLEYSSRRTRTTRISYGRRSHKDV